MKQSAYTKLIRKSITLKRLAPAIKEQVMNAKGDEMARYAEILSESDGMMSKAVKDLRNDSESAITFCRQDVKKLEQDKLHAVERRSRADEKSDKILEKLKNI
jgi:hypothetical protein